VASRCRRPAFADVVHNVIIHELNAWIKGDKSAAAKENSGRFTDVEEVRFDVDGDRLKPDGIRVVVFMESDLAPADRQAWRNWCKRVARQLRRVDGPKLRAVQFASLDKMVARQYRQLVPVRLSALGREPRVLRPTLRRSHFLPSSCRISLFLLSSQCLGGRPRMRARLRRVLPSISSPVPMISHDDLPSERPDRHSQDACDSRPNPLRHGGRVTGPGSPSLRRCCPEEWRHLSNSGYATGRTCR
jgi:hypothetical protein